VDAEALKQLPLILNGDVLDAALHAIIPPPNLSALSSLQVLDVSGWWLVATSERYWRTLAGCSSLRSLHGLHASVPPPAGVTFPHLTFLEVTTSTSPGDTLALLGAFPALEGVRLTVVPISSGADEVSDSLQRMMMCSELAMRLAVVRGTYSPPAATVAVSAGCRWPVWDAAEEFPWILHSVKCMPQPPQDGVLPDSTVGVMPSHSPPPVAAASGTPWGDAAPCCCVHHLQVAIQVSL
jgi:hypothetical protein